MNDMLYDAHKNNNTTTTKQKRTFEMLANALQCMNLSAF